jgi:hypothetical protein
MIGALGLGDDELAADELDPVTREDAKIDEPLVLDSLPAPKGERGLRQCSHRYVWRARYG